MPDIPIQPLLAKFNNQVTIFSQPALMPLVSFDCSISENHSRKSQVTEFETEIGQTVTDHIVVKPFKLHIQGIVSDSPLSALGALIKGAVTTGATAKLPPVGVLGQKAAALAALPLIADAANALASPSRSAYESLLALQDAKFPLTIVTTLYLYRNMWVDNIQVPRDAPRGQAVFFELDLVQLLLVTPITVNIAQFAEADLAAGAANKGEQGAVKPPASVVNGFNAGVAFGGG